MAFDNFIICDYHGSIDPTPISPNFSQTLQPNPLPYLRDHTKPLPYPLLLLGHDPLPQPHLINP